MIADPIILAVRFASRDEAAELLADLLALYEGCPAIIGPAGELVQALHKIATEGREVNRVLT